MSRLTDLSARERRAALADVRQQLLEPARALRGYSEELYEDAKQPHLRSLLPDLQRILASATSLSDMIDQLVDHDVAAVHANLGSDAGAAERVLRHDLRTPINAIKGYGEMLLEDLDELGAESLQPDLKRLLTHANTLLGRIDSIVQFSRKDGQTVRGMPSSQRAASELMQSLAALDDETESIETGHILVVDDIESNRDLLSRRLRRDGHTVSVAASGKEALDALSAQRFDIVLLDLMMPEMNGFQVLTHMKADIELRNIPVVMVSALDETDSVIRCIEAGADDYLTKPFNDFLLKARIKSGLENKHWSDDERRQRRFIREAFSRFVAPTVVDRLLEDPSHLSLGGERLDITCVFTDLADFTAMIERSAPSRVIPILNRYLDGMCRIVLEHQGTMDKIVGDALHAIFGAPLAQTDHPERAVRCALALDQFAREFAAENAARQVNFGATRIGVHSGVAVVGNFGGDTFFDYTAHGDVINTAARMENVNKYLGTTICVSTDTAARCEGLDFRPVGTLLLKGKTRSIDAFEPLQEGVAHSERIQAYRRGFALLVAEDNSARDAFQALHATYSEDPLIALHNKRLLDGESGALMVPNDR
ncbi:MAG: response regulator [Gammaproteobacteria bacterium]|nr:response regulator [Gammaproteobacteria bacterium]